MFIPHYIGEQIHLIDYKLWTHIFIPHCIGEQGHGDKMAKEMTHLLRKQLHSWERRIRQVGPKTINTLHWVDILMYGFCCLLFLRLHNSCYRPCGYGRTYDTTFSFKNLNEANLNVMLEFRVHGSAITYLSYFWIVDSHNDGCNFYNINKASNSC